MYVRFFIYTILLFPSIVDCSAIRMVIAEKEIAPNTYRRRILLGDIHQAKSHDISGQKEVLVSCFEKLNQTGKVPVLLEGLSQETVKVLKLIGRLFKTEEGDRLDSMLLPILSQEAPSSSYLTLADPREKLLLMRKFISRVGEELSNRIKQGQPCDDVLTQLRGTYTIGDMLDDYERTINRAIRICKDLKKDVSDGQLKKVVERSLMAFKREKHNLNQACARVKPPLRQPLYADFILSYSEARNRQLSVDEEAVLECIETVSNYAQGAFPFYDYLLELALVQAMIASDGPQTMVVFSGEMHNQMLIDLLSSEGFVIMYDSHIRLKEGGTVTQLFDFGGASFSLEWTLRFPFFDVDSQLDDYIEALDSNVLELMYERRKAFEILANRLKNLKDEL